jgi:hypothetical protein
MQVLAPKKMLHCVSSKALLVGSTFALSKLLCRENAILTSMQHSRWKFRHVQYNKLLSD